MTLIERLYKSHDAETLCADAARAIEALQGEVSTLDVLLEECKMDWSGDVTQIKAEYKREIEALQAENERLKAERDALAAKLVPLEADAERYRWLTSLRNGGVFHPAFAMCGNGWRTKGGYDAAIDAAKGGQQ